MMTFRLPGLLPEVRLPGPGDEGLQRAGAPAMTGPYDFEYVEREADHLLLRRRLVRLALVCSVLLAVTSLALTGPSDSQIEGNQRSAEASP
jgi:hypothetical protein